MDSQREKRGSFTENRSYKETNLPSKNKLKHLKHIMRMWAWRVEHSHDVLKVREVGEISQ